MGELVETLLKLALPGSVLGDAVMTHEPHLMIVDRHEQHLKRGQTSVGAQSPSVESGFPAQ